MMNNGNRSSFEGPLSDVTVIDLTQMLAGPYTTMLFADLGADVIKVEPPAGDMTRPYPPRHGGDEDYGGYFQSVNRNKRSLVIDLKETEGRELLEHLVKEADVLIENFKVGTMDGLGLSYEHLSEINPELVYGCIRGFGDPRTGESPYSNRPAFDLISQAFGGVMSITGTEETGPTKVGPGIGDLFPAVLVGVGVLAALHTRQETGKGQFVDVAMVDGILSLSERIVHQYSYTDEIPEPIGTSHPLIFPYDRFEASDGYVVIAAPTPKQWSRLCHYIGEPSLAEEYASMEDRMNNQEELHERIMKWTKTKTKQEIFDELGNDVPCSPVNTVKDIFEDTHFESRNMLASVEHGNSSDNVKIAGNPIKFTEEVRGVDSRAPRLGEHSREVLIEHGFSKSKIEELIEEGVIWDSDK